MFDRLSNWITGNENRPDAEAVSCYGRPRIRLIIRQFFIRMIGANFLFFAAAAPLVTLPAALCGLSRVNLNWTRNRPGGVWACFWAEFRTDFLKRTFFGLLLIFLPVSLCAYARAFGNDALASVFLFALGTPALIVADYFFPLLVLLDAPVAANLKNAAILAALEWKCSLKLLALTGSAALLLLFFFGPVFPMFLIGLFEAIQMIACVWVNEVIDRRFGRTNSAAEDHTRF